MTNMRGIFWRFVGMKPCHLCSDYRRIVDMTIKAFLVGWDAAVASHTPGCQLPQLIRTLDEELYQKSSMRSATERLAMLHMVIHYGNVCSLPFLCGVCCLLVVQTNFHTFLDPKFTVPLPPWLKAGCVAFSCFVLV